MERKYGYCVYDPFRSDLSYGLGRLQAVRGHDETEDQGGF